MARSNVRFFLFSLLLTLTLILPTWYVHASPPGTGGTWISGQPIQGGGGAGSGVVRLSTHAVLRVTASIHNSDQVKAGIDNGWTNPRNPDMNSGLLLGGSGNPRSDVNLIGIAVGSDIVTGTADIVWQGGTGSTLQMAHTLLLNNGPFTGTGPNFGSVPFSAVSNHFTFAPALHAFVEAHNLNINNLNARFPTAGDWATLSPQEQVEAAVAAMVVASAYGLSSSEINSALLGAGETFLVITLEALYTMETASPPGNYLGDFAWVSSWEIAKAVTGVSSHTGSTHDAFHGQGGVVNSSLGVVQGLRRAEGSPPTPLFQAFNQFFAGANAAGTAPLHHNARARQMFYYRTNVGYGFQSEFGPNAANSSADGIWNLGIIVVQNLPDEASGECPPEPPDDCDPPEPGLAGDCPPGMIEITPGVDAEPAVWLAGEPMPEGADPCEHCWEVFEPEPPECGPPPNGPPNGGTPDDCPDPEFCPPPCIRSDYEDPPIEHIPPEMTPNEILRWNNVPVAFGEAKMGTGYQQFAETLQGGFTADRAGEHFEAMMGDCPLYRVTGVGFTLIV